MLGGNLEFSINTQTPVELDDLQLKVFAIIFKHLILLLMSFTSIDLKRALVAQLLNDFREYFSNFAGAIFI